MTPDSPMDQRTRPHNGTITSDNLPFDIKDGIVSYVDAPSDLLCLALASKEWSSVVIPNHIDYRELEVRIDHSQTWQRLAIRADLAKNVRSVQISRPMASSIKSPEDPSPEMLTALSNFKFLQRFTWLGDSGIGIPSPVFPDSVFEVLVGCRELQEVQLWQASPRLDQLTTESSVL